MEEHAIDCYILAGKIAAQVREKSRKWVFEGARLLDVAEKIESEIISLGGQLAFPVNISLNEIAAHYTPIDNDTKAFQKEDMVKIDIGVHIDGYIADTATTIYIGSEGKQALVDASKSALEKAILKVKPGCLISSISETIENTIRDAGFNPVTNLTGHYLGRYSIHASPNIPNIKTDSLEILHEGDAIAIEPFATDGAGEVKDTGNASIFSIVRDTSARSFAARKILMFAKGRNGLPFASRWINDPKGLLRENGLRELVSFGCLHPYPPLKEAAKGYISQAEHTVIVGKKSLVITR